MTSFDIYQYATDRQIANFKPTFLYLKKHSKARLDKPRGKYNTSSKPGHMHDHETTEKIKIKKAKTLLLKTAMVFGFCSIEEVKAFFNTNKVVNHKSNKEFIALAKLTPSKIISNGITLKMLYRRLFLIEV